MKLSRLLTSVPVIGTVPPPLGDTEITGITSDSRRVRPGDLYVALNGLTTDGEAFIAAALAAGAAAVLAAHPHGNRCVCTENVRAALALVWNEFCDRPTDRLTVIAVTGTNGKTSVSHMIAAILKGAGHAVGLIGTLSGSLTTPDPAELYPRLRELADAGVTHVVMEASSHALALDKLAGVRIAAGVFTNLTPEHLDFHGTMEAYAAAKAKLFASCPLAVADIDSPYADAVCPPGAERVTCSDTGQAADYTAEDIVSDSRGVSYRLCHGDERIPIRCAVPARFTVTNTMLAAACTLSLGIGADTVTKALAAFSGVPGRMERILYPGAAVFVDYAHTPDALEKLLTAVRAFCQPDQRIWLVFGCGGDRDRKKRAQMGETASRLADVTVVTGDNARSEDPHAILTHILRGVAAGRPFTVIPDRRAAIRYALDHASDRDIVLLAGKGHETYEIGPHGRRNFSEREIVLAHGWRKTEKETQKNDD